MALPALGLLLGIPSPSMPAPAEEKPRATGVVEKAEVRLILLDVEARDREGRALRGLRKEDFHLRLGGRRWPIYSVDDVCACGEETAGAALSPAAPRPSGAASSAAAPRERPLVVIYLDFTLLQLDGRARALNEAIRWVRERKQPDDEVMLVGFAAPGGLREICPRTRDASRLEAALVSAKEDRSLVDTFAADFFERVRECDDCVRRCPCIGCLECCPCRVNGLQERAQGSRALRALKSLLNRLDDLPGRKAVLYFHQNGMIFPGSFYHLRNHEFEVGTHRRLLDEVGAEATTSRAAIYALQMQDNNLFDPLASAAVNLGAELADFTGGGYNRGPSDLAATIDRATRGCPCLYRLAFEPPDTSRTQVYQARVEVSGGDDAHYYRVQFLTQEDRLARSLRSVIALPEAATDIPLAASLEPVEAAGGKWSLVARLAMDVTALSLLPAAGAEAGQIDVGALLTRGGSSDSWEMLTGSKVRTEAGGGADDSLLYERTFSGLPPGVYHLRAFARDPRIDLVGGASASLALPAQDEAGLVGPFAVSPRPRVHTAALPLRKESTSRSPGPSPAAVKEIPAFLTGVRAGAHLDMTTWLCPAEGGTVDEAAVLRFVAREGVPAFRLPVARFDPAGRCTRLKDSVSTEGLGPGRYTYHVEWRQVASDPPRAGELSFTVAETSTAPVLLPAGRP